MKLKTCTIHMVQSIILTSKLRNLSTQNKNFSLVSLLNCQIYTKNVFNNLDQRRVITKTFINGVK